jgi:hypothetical protein
MAEELVASPGGLCSRELVILFVCLSSVSPTAIDFDQLKSTLSKRSRTSLSNRMFMIVFTTAHRVYCIAVYFYPLALAVKGKFVPTRSVKAHRGSRSVAPLALSLSTRRWSGFSFTLRPLYRRVKHPGRAVPRAQCTTAC